ncbi:hypothetical protein Scep_020904 [Stephania cephalantha]|uniref:Uncharacterized protein n=1 Tax=Stephania cephalantha TaxID=152367 RepID=A0AAP0F538_9MAGN
MRLRYRGSDVAVARKICDILGVYNFDIIIGQQYPPPSYEGHPHHHHHHHHHHQQPPPGYPGGYPPPGSQQGYAPYPPPGYQGYFNDGYPPPPPQQQYQGHHDDDGCSSFLKGWCEDGDEVLVTPCSCELFWWFVEGLFSIMNECCMLWYTLSRGMTFVLGYVSVEFERLVAGPTGHCFVGDPAAKVVAGAPTSSPFTRRVS